MREVVIANGVDKRQFKQREELYLNIEGPAGAFLDNLNGQK